MLEAAGKEAGNQKSEIVRSMQEISVTLRAKCHPLPHVRAAAVGISTQRCEEVFFLRSQASGGVGIIEATLLS